MGELREFLAPYYGLRGIDIYADTNTHTGNWCKVVATEDTVFNEIIIDGIKYASVDLIAGTEILGYISSIDLTSGTVVAYRLAKS